MPRVILDSCHIQWQCHLLVQICGHRAVQKQRLHVHAPVLQRLKEMIAIWRWLLRAGHALCTAVNK